MIVNALRGLVKSAGSRLPAFPPNRSHRAQASIPAALSAVASPDRSAEPSNRQLDQQIEKLAARYPEIAILRRRRA